MARSHHRKKHKEHLRQFKHSHDTAISSKVKGKAAGVFTFGGVVVGLATGFFASNGAIIWIVAGVAAGGLAGYFIGRRIDGDNRK